MKGTLLKEVMGYGGHWIMDENSHVMVSPKRELSAYNLYVKGSVQLSFVSINLPPREEL